MSTTIAELRKQLREHFPEAHSHSVPADSGIDDGVTSPTPVSAPSSPVDIHATVSTSPTDVSEGSTGVAPLDRIGIPAGAITEIVGHRPGCGVSLLIHSLLTASAKKDQPLALIDCRDHFDPTSADPGHCQSLLWLRCEDLDQSLRAADLLLRDGNLPMVLADFQLESPRALRAVPTSSWHRLRSLAQNTGTTFVLFSPAPLIPTAHLRLELKARFPLDKLNTPRATLLEELPLAITRQIGQHHHRRNTPLAAAG